MQRTPPGKSSSEADINKTFLDEGEKIRNSKRLRSSNSPRLDSLLTPNPSELTSFKQDLMTMLNSWKDDQDRRLTVWKTEQDATLTGLARDVLSLKADIAVLQKSSLEIDSGLSFINKMYEDANVRVVALETAKKEYQDCIRKLEKRIDDFQQQSRPSTLEIRNVPTRQDENPTDLSE
ncbi:unnamed protein product [Pieris macdunnoughi]|uniref:Uncharacterized protein n=1 Tax=Pieris macdunnoughi TaxID=345717 RepID=A0A821SP94_9NEOP|nr:unnamed protein product [Pieris macdunnoughi]